jgi:sRNA-binding regulator protein Hfq
LIYKHAVSTISPQGPFANPEQAPQPDARAEVTSG